MKTDVYAKASLFLIAGLMILAVATQYFSGKAEAADSPLPSGFAIAAGDAMSAAWVVGPSGNVWICRADRSCSYVGAVY